MTGMINALETRRRTANPAARLLAAWHLLSLDAPAVAACWTWFAARQLGTRPPAVLAPAMFCAVWLLYVLDRILDGLEAGAELQPRHSFHLRHRRRFVFTALPVLAALAWCVPLLPRLLPGREAMLGTVLAGWLGLVHLQPRRRLPKELVLGVFFSVAVFLPTASWRAMPWTVCFGALCSLNALLIRRWEEAACEGPGAGLDRATAWALGQVRELGWAVLLLALLLGILLRNCPLGGALALAAGLLLTLDRQAGLFEPLTLRALADLVLLTPLLWLL